jgi:hypothetical protein
METVFLEIIVNATDASLAGIAGRDEIEEPLEDMFAVTGLGEVTGGGGGAGVYIIDVEVNEDRFDEALQAIRKTLIALQAPGSTKIKKGKPDRIEFSIY